MHILHAIGHKLEEELKKQHRENKTKVKSTKVCSNSGNSTTFVKVKNIIVETLGVEEAKVTENTSLNDLGADSIEVVDVVMKLEQEFDMEFPEDEVDKITTVGDVVRYIENNKFR